MRTPSHFLVRDEQPLLFHTGLKEMFPLVRDAVASLIELQQLRWIGFSHVESDECGALPEWLAAAPRAQPLCSQIGARVNRDFTSSVRAARGMADSELLQTGKYRFRFCRTAQLRHGWDTGLLFEETTRSLLCSDLLHQNGNCAAVVEGCRQAVLEYQTGVLAEYVPCSHQTAENMRRLAALEPRTLATMHGFDVHRRRRTSPPRPRHRPARRVRSTHVKTRSKDPRRAGG